MSEELKVIYDLILSCNKFWEGKDQTPDFIEDENDSGWSIAYINAVELLKKNGIDI